MCYLGILGDYFFCIYRHPKTLGKGITRPLNKTFLDIIRGLRDTDAHLLPLLAWKKHVNSYFSWEIVFNALLYCKKTPLFIDGITININGNSQRSNSHLNRIIEDQKPNLNESGVYIYY